MQTVLGQNLEEVKMKILEKADTESWYIDCRCTGFGNAAGGCNSLLRVEKSDLVYWPGVDAETWGQRDPAVSFKCPVCNVRTDLGRDSWPKYHRTLQKVTASWYKDQEQEQEQEQRQANSGK